MEALRGNSHNGFPVLGRGPTDGERLICGVVLRQQLLTLLASGSRILQVRTVSVSFALRRSQAGAHACVCGIPKRALVSTQACACKPEASRIRACPAVHLPAIYHTDLSAHGHVPFCFPTAPQPTPAISENASRAALSYR